MTSIAQSLGFHATALELREQRNALLASNIANAATPGFKARDFDFATALAQQTRAGELRTDNPGHIRLATAADGALGYRQPVNPSLDGNTVEMDVEQMQFAQNTLHYQASLTFLNRRIASLTKAIKGE